MITVDDLVPLARGGTAELFAAWTAGQRVVVKLARDDRPGSDAALAAEAEVIERLASLTVAPRRLGRTRVRGRDALVLEHVALPTLRAAIPAISALAAPHAIAAAICAAVARIHAAGIVHADLTPDNLLLDVARGDVRLIDFGTAAVIGAPLAPLATIGYAAPERMVAGCLADPAVDVYALGVLCYELYTGVAPFDGGAGSRRVAHAAHRVPRISARVAVAPEIDDAIARAMAKSAAERPRDARVLLAALSIAPAVPAAPAPAVDAAAAPAPAPSRPRAPSRPALLVGARWAAGAATIRDAAARVGGVVAYSEADRHVAVLWRGDARDEAARLARTLAEAGAHDIEIVEADVQIGATGVPRGAAILALGRDLAAASPSSAAPAAGSRPALAAGTRPAAASAPPAVLAAGTRPCATPPAEDVDPRIEPGAARAAPLIGRDDAMQRLASAARTVTRGGAALVTVWGAPGMGKSRLAHAAIALLRDAGLAVIELCAPTVAALVDSLDARDVRGSHAVREADDAVERAALAALAGRALLVGSAAEPLAAAPGALRQAAARALARALRADRPHAVLIDDAHAADPIVLDALELATLAPDGALLVLALARPALATTRPRWSRRAATAEAITLAPLDRDDGRRLIRALLPAIAAVPSAALDRLVERCGGVPLYVTELVGALQRADRTRGATPTATRGALPTDLLELPAELGIVAWAVADELAGLPAGGAVAAEALAIAGDVERTALPALFAALDSAGIRIELDPGVAIADLLRAGLAVERAGVLRVRHDLVRDAITQRSDPARRAAIHRALLALAITPAERARHAEGAGDHARAALAWAEAARDALARHDDLTAETALGRALACAGDDAPVELLRQRGGARSRLGRHDAAALDFAAARGQAQRAGDRDATIDVLLDEATALDWSLHHARSAACVTEARALAGETDAAPGLRRARLAMATGRSAWRGGDAAAAIAPWRAAIELADAAGTAGYETAIACRLMLGFVLGGRGELAKAAAILDEAQAAATARGDVLHVAAARCNRYPVHAARGDAAGLRADLAAFAAAGRELGIAVTEYRGALYQAMVALWCGDDDGALALARAAHRLEAADPALFPRPCAALLLAELAARRDDRADAQHWCTQAEHHAAAMAPLDAVLREGLLTWLAGALDLATAEALARRAIALDESEAAFQLLELAARAATRRGDPDAAATAHRAARTLPPKLPRFLTAPEIALP